MKERESIKIDGRRKELKLIFQPSNLLQVLCPLIPDLTPNRLEQEIQKKCNLLQRELGVEVDQDHHSDLICAIDNQDIVEAFLIEAGRYPLLTSEQEQVLARKISKGKEIIFYLKQFSCLPNPDDGFVKAILNGAAAGKLLTNCNFRLVVSIAQEYINRGVSFVDLIQEGNIALMRAAEGFLPNYGKFSSYAKPAIERWLKKEIAQNGYSLRLPCNQERLIRRLHGIRDGLLVELGREPTVGEIATRMGIRQDKVEQLKEISQEHLSLDASLSKDGKEKSFYGLIGDDRSANPEKIVVRREVQEKIRKIIASLPGKKEREIIELHWELHGNRQYTLDEIGERLGLTGERVRQIETEILEKLLSHPSYRRKLKALL